LAEEEIMILKKSLFILIVILCCFRLICEEKIFSYSLKRTDNFNEKELLKNGNYIKVFYKNNKPVNGVVIQNNKKNGNLFFSKEGYLESLVIEKTPDNKKAVTKYFYDNNKLVKIEVYINSKIIMEMKLNYDNKNFITSIDALTYYNKEEQKNIVEYSYEKDIIIKKDSLSIYKFEKTYFKDSKNKIEYLDPIFYFLYRPFIENNKIIYKIESYNNYNIVDKKLFDEYGNVIL
jgi:hypothetical protein